MNSTEKGIFALCIVLLFFVAMFGMLWIASFLQCLHDHKSYQCFGIMAGRHLPL